MKLDTTLLDKQHPGLLNLYTFHTSNMWACGWLNSAKKLYGLDCIGAYLTCDINVVRKLFEQHRSEWISDDGIYDGIYQLFHDRLYPLDSENNIDYSLPSIPVDLGTLYEVR